MLLTPEQRGERAVRMLGAALGPLLIDHGWTLIAHPGEFCLKRDAEEINPFAITDDFISGKITREA